ncbi:MAG: OmpH family outer membrane protein [Myxococcota bacterium]
MRAAVAIVLSLALSSTAVAAEKMCVVDAEKAINETKEGKAAQGKLEAMYAAKQQELEKKGKAFEAAVKDFESRSVILSEEARAQEGQALGMQQQELQTLMMQAEQEMQETYTQMVATMESKLMSVASVLAAEKGCSVLFQKAAVIYHNSSAVTDLTSSLITAYDAK